MISITTTIMTTLDQVLKVKVIPALRSSNYDYIYISMSSVFYGPITIFVSFYLLPCNLHIKTA